MWLGKQGVSVRQFSNNLIYLCHFPVIEALTICNVLVNSRPIA
jgi:hypothetical protein